MPALSKSKLMAFRQCPKRLWLEIHKPELCEDSPGTEVSFRVGHEVGEIARRLYDPKGTGTFLDPKAEGFTAALKRSTTLLGSSQPIFEAAFSAGGVLARADVMLPVRRGGQQQWHMVEIKSTTKVTEDNNEFLCSNCQ